MRMLGSLCLLAVLAGCTATSQPTTTLAANQLTEHSQDATGEDTAPKLHCVMEKKVGSNFKTKVCMTREQLEESRRLSGDNMRAHAQKQGQLRNSDGL